MEEYYIAPYEGGLFAIRSNYDPDYCWVTTSFQLAEWMINRLTAYHNDNFRFSRDRIQREAILPSRL